MQKQTSENLGTASPKSLAYVWETAGAETGIARSEGFRTLDFKYLQPPCGPGKHAVELPLQMKIIDESAAGLVRNDQGEIVGIEKGKLVDVLDSLYTQVYEKVNGVNTTAYGKKMLKGMGDVIPFK